MGIARRIMQLQRRLPVWCALTPSNLSMVLVFALAYITVRAYVMKIIRQQRALVYQLQPPDIPYQYQDAGRYFSQAKSKQSLRDCPLLSLDKKLKANPGFLPGELQESFLYGSCQRVPPLRGSCDIAKEIFFSQPPATCSSQSSCDFCQVMGNPDMGWRVFCNETMAEVCQSKFSVGMMNQTNGELNWTGLESLSQLTNMLNKLLHRHLNLNHFGFVFIKCTVEKASTNLEDYEFDDEYERSLNFELPSVDSEEQLLILPPQFVKTSFSNKKDFRNVININIILIDSVSHQHFFRSLNSSVNMFRKIQVSSHPSASVFDFELVQAIKSRTYENLQAIFGGIVDITREPFETQGIPPEPLKLKTMLGGFKQQGYKTLWLEDLCHEWEWGLSKDLLFLKGEDIHDKDFWDNMWQKLYQAGLDDVGPTLAMCRVLQANKVRDHFHGPDAVCFNGRHQHEYLFDYLLMYQQSAYAAQQPTFTFLQTNVAHEDSGRRIQTLDKALASYLESVSHLSNTLTIILSDHGNSYGAFHKKSQEAKRELYHPAMFFIVPNRVGRILGKDAMNALRLNTKRLVSFLDLHKALLHLQSQKRKSLSDLNPSSLGLFFPVASSRTCNDIPRVKPNLCICEFFETPVANSSDYSLLGYFAIGRLNDEIQKQALKHSAKKSQSTSLRTIAFPLCERLVLRGVENIKENVEEDGSLNIKMELLVQMSQIFLVSLVMQPHFGEISHSGGTFLKLQTYERLTSYGQFTPCAEADGVWPSLCVCTQIDSNLAGANGSRQVQIEDVHRYNQIGNSRDFNINANHELFNFTFDIDINIDHAYNSDNGDIKTAENPKNEHLLYNGKLLIIPQHHNYIKEKVLPGYRLGFQYLKKHDKFTIIRKLIAKQEVQKCLLLMWVKHPKGVVLSVVNTCQYYFSVIVRKPHEKASELHGPSSLLYTAPSPVVVKEAVLMPRGIKLLAVAWDQNKENLSLASLLHLQLQVELLS